jgi:S1-C subfamily serine protease
MRKTGFAFLATTFFMLLALPVISVQAPAQQVPQSREQISMSFAPVVRNTAPSVVNVYAKRIVQSQQGRAPFGADPFSAVSSAMSCSAAGRASAPRIRLGRA